MTGIINVGGSAEMQDITSLPVLAFYGTRQASGFGIPSSNIQASCNPDYFEYDSDARTFLCKKSFTGNVYVLSTSNYSAAGSNNVITYCQWRLYIDDALYTSATGDTTIRYNTYSSVPYTTGKSTYIHGYCYSTAANKKTGKGDYLYIVTL